MMSCLSWMRGKRVLNRFFLSELSIHKAFSHHSTKLQHVLLSSFIGARIYHLLHQHKCRNINTGSKPNIFHLVLVFTLILLNLIQDPVFFFFFFGNLSKRHCLSLLLYNWISFKLSFVLSFSVKFMQCWAFLFLVQYTQSCGFSACQSGERMSGQFAYQIYWRRRGLCACQIYWRRRGLSACQWRSHRLCVRHCTWRRCGLCVSSLKEVWFTIHRRFTKGGVASVSLSKYGVVRNMSVFITSLWPVCQAT